MQLDRSFDEIMAYIIFPILLLGAFRLASRQDLTCPSLTDDSNLNIIYNTTYSVPKVSTNVLETNSYKLKGFDCYKIIMKTTCEANLLSKNRINYEKVVISVDEKECKLGSSLELIEYPIPHCEWNMFSSSINVKTLEFIHYKEKSYYVNPQTGFLVGQMELFNYCDDKYCVYKRNQGIWIKDKNDNTYDCSKHNVNTMYVADMLIGKVGDRRVIKVSNRTIYEEDVCTISRCGVKLMYLSDFEIYKLPTGIDFKKCKEGHVTMIKNNQLIKQLQSEIECVSYVEDMISSKTINYEQLRKLHPTNIGVHKVYRLNSNQKLEVSMAYYTRIDDIEIINKENHWITCGKKYKCSYNGAIHLGELILNGTFSVDDYTRYIDEKPEPIVINLDYEPAIKDMTLTTQQYSESSTFNLISKYWMWTGELLLIVISVCCLLTCIIRSCKSKGSHINLISGRRVNDIY